MKDFFMMGLLIFTLTVQLVFVNIGLMEIGDHLEQIAISKEGK